MKRIGPEGLSCYLKDYLDRSPKKRFQISSEPEDTTDCPEG